MGMKSGICGVTPALRSMLLSVNSPQCTQSSAPSSVRLTTASCGMGVKVPVNVAPLRRESPPKAKVVSKNRVERSLSVFPTIVSIQKPRRHLDFPRGAAVGCEIAAKRLKPFYEANSAPIRPACLPDPFRGHMPIEIKFVAHVAMHRFVRQVAPPGDRRIGNVDLVHVGDGEKRRGRAVFVQLRSLQGCDF